MKKILLATVAVMALSASAAQAEVNLDLGGYFKGYAGYADQDSANRREFDVKRKSEITFTGETTLDNGLTVGYEGQLVQENTTAGDQIENSYLYFSGNWGRVNMGRNYGAAYLLQVSAPGADSNIDGQDIDFSFMNLSGNINQDYQHNGETSSNHFNDSITYLTPKFNGFQAGVTYSAAVDQKDRSTTAGLGNTAGMELDNSNNDLENLLEVGARYDGDFNGVGLHLGAGYTTAGEEVSAAGSDDYNEWNVGAKLTFDAFGFGAAYNEDNGQVDSNDETQDMIIGADYTWGAYKFGASYFNSTGEAGANTADDELDRYTVGATYTFGPGMDFRGAVAVYDLDRAATVNDNEGTVVTLGTDIQF